MIGYVFSVLAAGAVAVALIYNGHWIAACIMAVLLWPSWERKSGGQE